MEVSNSHQGGAQGGHVVRVRIRLLVRLFFGVFFLQVFQVVGLFLFSDVRLLNIFKLPVQTYLVSIKAGFVVQHIVVPQQIAQGVIIPAALNAVQGQAQLLFLLLVGLVDDGAEHFFHAHVTQHGDSLVAADATHIVDVHHRRLNHAVLLQAPAQGFVLVAALHDVLAGVVRGRHNVLQLQNPELGLKFHRTSSFSAPRTQAPA